MSDHEPVNILLVDDTPGKLLSYEVILKDLGENLIKVSSAKDALAELLRNEIALILTDVCMPDLDGFEFAKMLRQHPRYEQTAVIFISAVHLSQLDYVQGYGCGAVDYVGVPVVPEILRAKVKIFAELYRKTKDLERLNAELEHRVSQRTKELQESSLRLVESEKRLLRASRAAGFGSYEYDVAADRMHWSSQLKPFADAGVPAPESLCSLLDIVHADDRAVVRNSMLMTSPGSEGRHDIEFRTILANGNERWILDRGRLFHDASSGSRILGTMLDITERKYAEAHQGLLLAELDHRVKNILANVLAIANLSSRDAGSVSAYVNALQGRIQSMAIAHDLLRRSNWRGASFHGLAQETLRPFQSKEGNIQLDGSHAHLNPKAAQAIALVLHELATNAVKHGALSQPAGCVFISCEKIADTRPVRHRFTWRESGGPPVHSPEREGFGLTALRAAASEAAAHADLEFTPAGLVYTLEGPLGAPEEDVSQADVTTWATFQTPSSDSRTRPQKGQRVLVVEDEPFIAMELQALLESEGHTVVGPALNLERARKLVDGEQFDLVLLDINMGDEKSTPIAIELLDLGISFAFVTGYADAGFMPSRLQAVPRINKPYGLDEIREIIDILTRGAVTDPGSLPSADSPSGLDGTRAGST